jgi:pilus assembly protein CpaB
MTTRRALLALSLITGIVAGALYLVGTHRTPVIVAAQHLSPGRAIGPNDVEMRWLPADAIPAGAITDTATALGRYPRAPMWPGQLVLAGTIAPTNAIFDSGLTPPTGYRAVAIPVAAEQALGGAIAPGARVDVIAIPAVGRAPDGQATELLVEAALVIDVRGDQGGPFERERPASSGIATRERLGSVVIAVGPSDELIIADRIATSSFVLVLVPERP